MEHTTEGECSEDEEVDPRVKDELDALNAASVEINKLETEIDKARTKFRMLLTESTSHLNLLHKKLGKAVDKSRAYHEQLKETKKAEVELQKATVKYQRAQSLYTAAKETVELAEQRMAEKTSDDDRPEFDTAWQEMMNHATMKFMEAEKERHLAEQQHQQCASEFATAQQKLHVIDKDIPRSIKRSRPYFDLKDHLETRLQQERQSVEDLQRALTAAKEIYRNALSNLESISEEIHAARQQRKGPLPPRTPGVGAEAGAELSSCDSNTLDSLSINLDAQSLKSVSLLDDADVISLSSQDVNFALTCGAHIKEPPHKPAEKASHPLACSGVETTFISAKPPAQSSTPPTFKKPQPPADKPTGERREQRTESSSRSSYAQGAIPKQKPQLQLQDRIENHESHNVVEIINSSINKSSPKESDRSKMSPRGGDISSSGGSPVATKSRGRPKDKRVQKLTPSHFPMLQGLMDTNKAMSPKLPEGRPKGREVVQSHSPSPVRKNTDGYFVYPSAKSASSKGAIAREIEGGEDLFQNSESQCNNLETKVAPNDSTVVNMSDSNATQKDNNIDAPVNDSLLHTDQGMSINTKGELNESQSSSSDNRTEQNLSVVSQGQNSPRGEGEGQECDTKPTSKERGKEGLGSDEGDLEEGVVYEV